MPENSVTLHRVLKASPEKVYRAFTDPLAYASWISLDMCYLGWQDSLDKLQKLVEPEIPDN